MVRTLNYSFWLDKKVLITGHSGFKGSWLLCWLIKLGANVRGISLKPETKINLFNQIESSLNNKFINVFGNILDKNLIKQEVNDFKILKLMNSFIDFRKQPSSLQNNSIHYYCHVPRFSQASALTPSVV